MKKIPILAACLIIIPCGIFGQVRTGLDNLIANNFALLKEKKIGLICNRTSVSSEGEFSPKVFLEQRSFRLIALFSPEHGFSGERKAGVPSDSMETFRGVPVYSLYGKNRKPSKSMLKHIDVLLFDLQDIGVRPYTYLATMIYAMEAAAEYNIRFVVLDRPNPLSGERVEGNILDTSLKSFVGILPIPYVHGMTLGELAEMAKGEGWFDRANKLKLTVIKMTGWNRKMYWNETGLPWIAPSPNIPTFQSSIGCAMFGAIGELGILSVGIGSDLPFLRIGSKLVTPDFLQSALKSSLPDGIRAKRQDYTVPFADTEKSFNGMKIELPHNLAAASAFYGPEFILLGKLVKDTVFRKSFDALPFAAYRMFQKVTGLKTILTLLKRGADMEAIVRSWEKETKLFRAKRKKYLLYD